MTEHACTVESRSRDAQVLALACLVALGLVLSVGRAPRAALGQEEAASAGDLAAPGSGAAAGAGAPLRPYGRLPVSREWRTFGYVEFLAPVPTGAAGPVRASVRVSGPREWQFEVVPRVNYAAFECGFVDPGAYRVECVFADGDGNAAGTEEWQIRVRDGVHEPLGAPVDPDSLEDLVFIGGGPFTPGPPGAAAQEVKVEDFYIGRFPVTVSQYCTFLNARGNEDCRYFCGDDCWNRDTEDFASLLKGRGGDLGPAYPEAVEHRKTVGDYAVHFDEEAGEWRPRGELGFCPAAGVTWFGAAEYCRWMTERTGRVYRLPTALEWEYACGGPEKRRYPWGDVFPSEDDLIPGLTLCGMSYSHCGRERGDTVYVIVNVGSFPYSNTPEGVADMVGQVEQWCSDVRGDPPPELLTHSVLDLWTSMDRLMGEDGLPVITPAMAAHLPDFVPRDWDLRYRAIKGYIPGGPPGTWSGAPFHPAAPWQTARSLPIEDLSRNGFRVVVEPGGQDETPRE